MSHFVFCEMFTNIPFNSSRALTARLFEPHQQAESSEPEAKPAAPIGPHQQRYTEKAPMQHEITPLFQLLRDFPEDEADATDPATARDEPSPQTRPAPDSSPSSKKRSRRQRKAGKNSAKKRRGLTRDNPR